MGTIVSEFTCVEFDIPINYDKKYVESYEEYEQRLNKLKNMIEKTRYEHCFNLVVANNGILYFTAAPCGSKEGWPAKFKYNNELDDICKAIRLVAGYFIIKRITTSAG